MKQISSTLIWSGSFLRLYSDRLILDNGAVAQRDLIRHPGGAAILLIQDEQILLVSQYRHGAGKQLLEIPAGKLEAGETPERCARRELEEESGMRCGALRLLYAFYPSPGICSERLYLFEARDPAPISHPRPMDPDEDLTLCWIPLKKAKEMLARGEIEDAKTIIALQYACLNH